MEREVTYYAQEQYLTPRYFSAIIKEKSGISALQWIIRMVIADAKQILRSSDLSIKEIASELNFSTQSFFGKYFKQYVGISPTEYRNGKLVGQSQQSVLEREFPKESETDAVICRKIKGFWLRSLKIFPRSNYILPVGDKQEFFFYCQKSFHCLVKQEQRTLHFLKNSLNLSVSRLIIYLESRRSINSSPE